MRIFNDPRTERDISLNIDGFMVGKPSPWEGKLRPQVAKWMFGNWELLIRMSGKVKIEKFPTTLKLKLLGFIPFIKVFNK